MAKVKTLYTEPESYFQIEIRDEVFGKKAGKKTEKKVAEKKSAAKKPTTKKK